MGVAGRLDTIGGVDLVEDVADVGAHRARADIKLLGYLRVAPTSCYQLEDFYLPLGQSIRISRLSG